MTTISPILKKLLYNKQEHEPLTAAEQAEYDEIYAWLQPTKPIINLNDPAVKEALQIYNHITAVHTTTWEQSVGYGKNLSTGKIEHIGFVKPANGNTE